MTKESGKVIVLADRTKNKPLSGRIPKALCEQIKSFIKKRNLSNAALARLLEVEPWTVGAWLERDTAISKKNEEKLSALFKIPDDCDPALYMAVKPLKRLLIPGAMKATQAKAVQQTANDILPELAKCLLYGPKMPPNFKLTGALRELFLTLDHDEFEKELDGLQRICEEERYDRLLPMDLFLQRAKLFIGNHGIEDWQTEVLLEPSIIVIDVMVGIDWKSWGDDTEFTPDDIRDAEKDRLRDGLGDLVRGTCFERGFPETIDDDRVRCDASADRDDPNLRDDLVRIMRRVRLKTHVSMSTTAKAI